MDYSPPKEVAYICDNCNHENKTKIHWRNSFVFEKCAKCKNECRIDFRNGKLKQTVNGE